MMRLVAFSVRRPKTVFLITFAATVLAAVQFGRIRTDTNPKNMLPATSDVRRLNREVDRTFALYEDVIIVGVKSERGVLNPQTLKNIHGLTEQILALPGVAEQDVTSLSTITNVDAEGDTLRVGPLMSAPPRDAAEVRALETSLVRNPLFKDRIISEDHKTTAIYVPIHPGANGTELADRIQSLLPSERGGEEYFITGDPVVRDTFGVEMFRVMGIFAPIAGFIMMLLAYFMFGRLSVAMTVMLTAMVITIWSLGAVIGFGYPVHIMTSMAPVFLMAIATDSIHIFNEYFYRAREIGDRREAILATMRATRLPLLYTDLTTAFAFLSLTLASIIPLRVFGVCVAIGTIALLLLSFTFVPAVMTMLDARGTRRRRPDGGASSHLLRALAGIGARRPKSVVAASLLLTAMCILGMSRLTVNNNQVEWFDEDSDVRQADSILNAALGGTSAANIVVTGPSEDAFKTAEGLGFVARVERALLALPEAGAALSLADYVKRINQVLHGGDPARFSIPDDSSAIAQYVFLFSTSARTSDIANVVESDFKQANILLQLKTSDASAMRRVVEVLDGENRSAPKGYSVRPAGTAYFGLVWNDAVLWDMLKGFAFGLVAVFLILALNFRSFKWAVVSYLPLALTIAIIYGFVGFIGKDFDMPIAVLSCLSLGMAVDFAIHFVGRLRQRLAEAPDDGLLEAVLWTAARPGRGILRNAVLFAAGFGVMLFAPLTPYVTVGAFMVAMMLLSAFITLVLLPSIVMIFEASLFRARPQAAQATASGAEA